jgi:hypothetical protein
VGGWPIAAVITIIMSATYADEKYTRRYIAERGKREKSGTPGWS